jgi:hypothetical protein
MTAGEGFDAWVDQELDTRSQDAAVPWTTYLLHFDRPYKHARHLHREPREFRITEGLPPGRRS